MTQFINSHRPHFLLVILVILLSKKMHLDFLTIFLNFFQFSRLQDYQYLLRFLWQSLFHHTLECLVMLAILECLSQVFLILIESSWTIFLRVSVLGMDDMSKLLIKRVSFLRNWFSLLLSLMRDHHFVDIYL